MHTTTEGPVSPAVLTQLQRNAYEVLDQLGTTSDEVADTLGILGIVGIMGVTDQCPVALHLATATGLHWFVREEGFATATVRGNPLVVTLPDPVVEFTQWYDVYSYPGLVDHVG